MEDSELYHKLISYTFINCKTPIKCCIITQCFSIINMS